MDSSSRNRDRALTAITILEQLVDAANRASVVFYTIDPRGLIDTGLTAADKLTGSNLQKIANTPLRRSRQIFQSQAGLKTLAKETGGIAYMNQNRIYEGVREAIDDQSYYLIGYQPDSDTFDAKTRRFNKLEIKVKRPDAVSATGAVFLTSKTALWQSGSR